MCFLIGCALNKVANKDIKLNACRFRAVCCVCLPENEVHKASFSDVLYILSGMPLSLTGIVTGHSQVSKKHHSLAYASVIAGVTHDESHYTLY